MRMTTLSSIISFDEERNGDIDSEESNSEGNISEEIDDEKNDSDVIYSEGNSGKDNNEEGSRD